MQLETKIAARRLHRDSNWEPRLTELYQELARRDPLLPAAVVAHAGFGRPGHAVFVAGLPEPLRETAVAAFVRKIRAEANYPWSNEVVLLLGNSADPDHRQLVREQYDRFAVRGAVLLALARRPLPLDRSKFVSGLDSSQLEVLSACTAALAQLPVMDEAGEQVALVRTMRRLGGDAREYALRERVVRLLQRNLDVEFGFRFGKPGHVPQSEAIERWTAHVAQRFPRQAGQLRGGGGVDPAQLAATLAEVDWSRGDAARGSQLFEKRSCRQCHGGRRALGPDLAGVARRFSRADLFTAIADPQRDVSPRYQTTLVQTTGGKQYSGWSSTNRSTDSPCATPPIRRFASRPTRFLERQKRNASLMPDGLLKGLTPLDLADLYAYLASLGR